MLLCLPWLAHAAGSAGNTPSSSIYCCQSPQGQRMCGDVLPPQCYGKEYQEVTPSGRVKRVVPAELTPEQRAAQEAAVQERKDREIQAAANHRRDEALLNSYSSVDEIDERRDRQIDDVQRSIQQYKERETELISKRGAIQRELERFQDKEVPPNLQRKAEANATDLANVQDVLASKGKEINEIRERFAQDRKRYIELTTR